MIAEYVSMLASLIVAMVSLVASLIFYKYKKDSKYNEEKNRAELDMLRHSHESKIYELMERVVRNEKRWSEANHLVVSAQINRSDDNRRDFLSLNGIPKDLKTNHKMAFILTPYHDLFSETCDQIKSACQSVGITALRGDEEHVYGDILSHTLRLMCSARIIIANIDGRNPNVFYELGLAHALNKDVIIVASSLDNIPVDVKSNRIILHDKNNLLAPQLKDAITRALLN